MTDLLRVLAAAVAPDHQGRHARLLRRWCASGPVDWRSVGDTAGGLMLGPALWHGLEGKSLASLLPPPVAHELREHFRLNVLRNTGLRKQLRELARAFNAIGVTPVVLDEGAWLPGESLEAPGVPVVGSLNLLVPRQALVHCQQAMEQLGYGYDVTQEQRLIRHHHCAPRCRDGDFGAVRLHRQVVADPFQAILPTGEARGNVRVVEWGGVRLKVLSPDYRLFHNFVRSELVGGHSRRADLDLRALHGFACLLHEARDGIDWAGLLRRADERGVGGELRACVTLSHRLLGTDLPAGLAAGAAAWIHALRCRLRPDREPCADLERATGGFPGVNPARPEGCGDGSPDPLRGGLFHLGHLFRRTTGLAGS